MAFPQLTRLQWLAHLAAWIPVAWIAYDGLTGGWTVNPIQYLTLRTGKAALILLTASLACTPLNLWFGWKQFIKLRRPLGLYAFFYAFGHVAIFIVLDYGLDARLIVQGVIEKRYILAGLAAFLCLLPLAITSTKGWMARLGKRWKSLHKLAYIAGLAAVFHYVWLVKADLREPLTYGAVVGLLLLARVGAVKRLTAGLRSRINRRWQAKTGIG